MKTLFLTVLIAVLALGFVLATIPGKAEAWHRGPFVSFSVVVPPFGVAVGVPGPYYYPAPVYAAPPYYRSYYRPYYRPYYRQCYWDRWIGDWRCRLYRRY